MLKTIEDLINEVQSGDCIIKGNTRYVKVARIVVTFGALTLVEAKQTKKSDGSIHKRLYACVSEKIHSTEDPLIGAIRGIREELGLKVASFRFVEHGEYEEVKDSASYPFLDKCIYCFHNFRLELSAQEFNPDGYEADEGDVITTFEWRRISIERKN